MNEERYEIKFILNEDAYTNAMHWIKALTNAQLSYEPRYVNSLYFDDVEFNSIRDNLAGISNREKLRLRWYHKENERKVNNIALESKIRVGRLCVKKQSKLLGNANSLFDFEMRDIIQRINESLNSNEAKSLLSNDFYSATLHVVYSRDYYECSNGLRITFDSKIEFRPMFPHSRLFQVSSSPYPYRIMEIKFASELKNYVSDLIRPLHMMPKRHSKYVTGMSMFNSNINYI